MLLLRRIASFGEIFKLANHNGRETIDGRREQHQAARPAQGGHDPRRPAIGGSITIGDRDVPHYRPPLARVHRRPSRPAAGPHRPGIGCEGSRADDACRRPGAAGGGRGPGSEIRRFRGDSSLRTWLLGIALNECRRAIRRGGTEPLPLEVDLVCPVSDDETSVVDRQALAAALARLSDDHRDVVILHELQGLTYEEVAAVLRVPVGTVKSRLHHAFLNLRREMGA